MDPEILRQLLELLKARRSGTETRTPEVRPLKPSLLGSPRDVTTVRQRGPEAFVRRGQGVPQSVLVAEQERRRRESVPTNENLLTQSDNVLGTWWDKDGTGKHFLDVSTVLDDKDAAIALARKNGQDAIFNLETFETVRIDPEFVRAPAFLMRDGRIIHGEPGEIHGDVFRRLSNKDKANISDESGFVTSTNRFVTRNEAGNLVDEFDLVHKPTKEGLHSTDLTEFRQAEEQAMRRGNFSDKGRRGARNTTIVSELPATVPPVGPVSLKPISAEAARETQQAARGVADDFFKDIRTGRLASGKRRRRGKS